MARFINLLTIDKLKTDVLRRRDCEGYKKENNGIACMYANDDYNPPCSRDDRDRT